MHGVILVVRTVTELSGFRKVVLLHVLNYVSNPLEHSI
jgi:hypothetical protein